MAEAGRIQIGETEYTVSWAPQAGPQELLLACPVYDVLYGGARGGGKTDAMLAEFVQHAHLYGKHAIGRMFRRTIVQLSETIERAKELYGPLGAKWRQQGTFFRFPNGARLAFSYLERDEDADSYQGHSYTRIYVEELGNFPSASPVKKLAATLRSAHGVPVGFRATANPGGPGHGWVKARYIDPAPGGYKILTDRDTGLDRVYIPARIIDNPALLNHDPTYIARLRSVGSDQLVRAWLDGDWDIVEGAYFDNWSAGQHVIRPCELPAHWTRFRAIDWGSARPFSVGWYAVSDGSNEAFPARALIRFREWYGMRENQPNTGIKLNVEEVAAGILERDGDDVIKYGIADPAIFASDGGPSIAERFARAGVIFRRGDNKRIPGWEQVRARLDGEDGRPMLYVFSTCPQLIRTLPALQHDEHRLEDVDTDGEDHACFAAGTIVDGLGLIEVVGVKTRCATAVVRLSFEDGRSVVCTPDHLFLGEDGQWRRADVMQSIRSFSARQLRSSWVSGFIAAGLIISARAVNSIARFGNIITGLFRKAGTFTIETMIAAITNSPTWSFSRPLSISASMAIATLPFLRERVMPQQSGMAVWPDESGTQNIGMSQLRRLRPSVSQRCARFAGNLLRRAASLHVARGSATRTAVPLRCVNVERLSERRDVYCMATREALLSVQGGLVASNCDELRYACMSRPYAAPAPEDARTRWPHELTMDELVQRQMRRHSEGARV